MDLYWLTLKETNRSKLSKPIADKGLRGVDEERGRLEVVSIEAAKPSKGGTLNWQLIKATDRKRNKAGRVGTRDGTTSKGAVEFRLD